MGTLPIPVETMLSEGASAPCELITPTTEAVNPGVCLCTSDLCCILIATLVFGLSMFVCAHTLTL